MAIYVGDQQTTQIGLINGVHTAMTPAVVKTLNSAGATTYQFTAPFTCHNPASPSGAPLSFRTGVAYNLDPTEKTTLLALGAPMVAV